VYGEYVL